MATAKPRDPDGEPGALPPTGTVETLLVVFRATVAVLLTVVVVAAARLELGAEVVGAGAVVATELDGAGGAEEVVGLTVTLELAWPRATSQKR
jgi:hypothetical protein